MTREIPKIEAKRVKLNPEDDYPSVRIYCLEISRKDGVWLESYATEIEVKAFLRGFQAGSQMTGGPYISLPEIPQVSLLD